MLYSIIKYDPKKTISFRANETKVKDSILTVYYIGSRKICYRRQKDEVIFMVKLSFNLFMSNEIKEIFNEKMFSIRTKRIFAVLCAQLEVIFFWRSSHIQSKKKVCIQLTILTFFSVYFRCFCYYCFFFF